MSTSPDRRAGVHHHQRTKSGYQRSGSGEGRSPHGRERAQSGNRPAGSGGGGRGSPHGEANGTGVTMSSKPHAQEVQQHDALPVPSQADVQQGPPPDVMVTSPGGSVGAKEPQDKKVRALLKKIRAIEELKMRQASGEKLEDTQVKKIQTEGVVRKELKDLTGED